VLFLDVLDDSTCSAAHPCPRHVHRGSAHNFVFAFLGHGEPAIAWEHAPPDERYRLLLPRASRSEGGPSAITPIQYAKTLTNKFGSEDLIDSAELAQRGPRMFRDWNDVDKLYDKRQLTALSKMITGAALNEVNGALALLVRCSELVYSYERNWLEFYQDVILTSWPEQSPTSIPQGISFISFTREGSQTAYAASVAMPNAVLCDPNFGDTRLQHMLQARPLFVPVNDTGGRA
jgi:hypothetical protein